MAAGATTGGAIALGGAILGAIGSAKAARESNALIARQRQENRDWWNIKRAEDFTQRPDTQALLNKQREMLEERYRQSRAANVVTGGTDEALAMQQAAANSSLADATAQLAGQAAIYKDNAEQQYRAQDAALNQQQVQVAQNKAQNIASAAGQAVSAGVGLMGVGLK